jgi:CheY-like chemotaxis protein
MNVLLIDDDGGLAVLGEELSRRLGEGHLHSVRGTRDPGRMLGVLAAHDIDAVVLRAPGSGAEPVVRHRHPELQHEILVRYPWLVQILLTDPQPLPGPPGSAGWSERQVTWPCSADRLLQEAVQALARRDRERRPGSGSAGGGPDAHVEPIALFIGDASEQVGLLRQALSHTGCGLDCWTVEDGAQALGFLTHAEGFAKVPAPHVILIDLNLPNMNGYEFLARYRGTGLPLAPVVVLSASDRADEAQDAIRHGAAACIAKPTSWDRYLALAINLDRIARLTALAQDAGAPRGARRPAVAS